MADNVAITAGTGTTIATDEVTINATTVQAQRMKLILGRDGTYTADLAGRDLGSGDGALYVDPRQRTISSQVTPTVSTIAYASGDCLGGLQTISNAVRVSGSSGRLMKVTVLDKTQAQRPSIDLVFFDRSVTVAGDNNPFACSDADMAFCLGVLSISTSNWNTAWPGTPLNSLATLIPAAPLSFVANATDLFVQAVVRATPTLTSTSDLIFTYTIEQD